MRRLQLLAVVVALLALVPASAHARAYYSNEDRSGFGNHIVVEEGDSVGDIACAFCDVTIHGKVSGDIAIAFGTLTLDQDRRIAGDVASFGTHVTLGQGATIGGDVFHMAGAFDDNGAKVSGDKFVTTLWLWAVIPFAPLLILAGIIWLIVHVIRQRRFVPPPYPGGYPRR